MRKFGWIKVIPDQKLEQKEEEYGPEPLEEEFTPEYLQDIFSKTRRPAISIT